jgi:cytochrome b6-f complex iron-sulfur subunit
MDRRTFLGFVGIGALASSLPMVIAGCTSNSQTPQGEAQPSEVARADGFQVVGTVDKLDKDGKIETKTSNSTSVLVVRETKTKKIYALNPSCTHQGCPVAVSGGNLGCGCHGSKFALDGKVIGGPATKGLAQYQVKQEDKNILVKV